MDGFEEFEKKYEKIDKISSVRVNLKYWWINFCMLSLSEYSRIYWIYYHDNIVQWDYKFYI